MKVCLKEVGAQAIKAYTSSVREDWVLEWPGQVVLSGSQTHWTTEVSHAISSGEFIFSEKIGKILDIMR